MEQLKNLSFGIKFILLTATLLVIFLIDFLSLFKKFISKIKFRKPTEEIVPLESPQENSKTPFSQKIFYFLKHHLLLLTNLIVISLCLCNFSLLLNASPRVIKTYPNANETLLSYQYPITIEFNVPISKTTLETYISPDIEGRWIYKEYWLKLPWTRKIYFSPTQSFSPQEKVMIYLSYISNEIHPDPGNEYFFEFFTPQLPQILKTSVDQKDIELLPNSEISISLNRPDDYDLDWKTKSTPDQEFEIIRHYDKEIILKPKSNLNQGQNYAIQLLQIPTIYNLETKEIIQSGQESLLTTLEFKTVSAPLISSVSPSGTNILTDSLIEIVFDNPMDTASVETGLSFTPEIRGDVTWEEENKKLKIAPFEPLTKETPYEIKLEKGIKNQVGGIIETDLIYNFTTLGAINLKSISPTSNATGILLNSQIRIEFDQLVDHLSAETNFTISPTISGSFSWNENIMIFTPKNNLTPYTTYTYSLYPEVISVHGLNSRDTFTFSFTTISERVVLNVPLYYQQESYTCNIAAATMMLAYRGVSVSEATLKSQIDINGSRGDGNPHKGYTLNYGTYWEPISAAVSNYRNTQVFTNWSLSSLLTEVEKGNPVMVWGQNGWSSPTNISWTASDGTYIYAISGMHSYIVKGFIGSKENPSSILINDPWRGDISLSPSVFNSRWSYFRTGMVVY